MSEQFEWHWQTRIKELEARIDALEAALREADTACFMLCTNHGFATGHGDTVTDMIGEIDAQISTRIEAVDALEKMATDSDAELTQLTHTVVSHIKKIEALDAALRDCIQIADDFECHLCGYPNHEAEQYYDSGVIDASNMIAERIRARAALAPEQEK